MAFETGLDEILDDTGPAEQLVLYNGTEIIYYNDKLHSYYKVDDNGQKLLVSGVTSAVGKIDKSGPLTQWAANMTIAHLREKIDYRQFKSGGTIYTFVTKEQLEPLFEDARFNFKVISNVAKDVGKIAHNWLEVFVKGTINGSIDDQSAFSVPEDEAAAKCVKAAMEWMAKHNFKPLNAEKKIYSKEYNYSGTYDWLAYITSCNDTKCCPFEGTVLALGDWKSSKSLWDEYLIQTAAYVKAHEEEFPEQTIAIRVLIRLGKEDGEFESRVLTRDTLDHEFNVFLGALAIYNWEKQIKLQERYEREVAKAEAKAIKELEKAKNKEEKEAAKAKLKLEKEEAKAALKAAKAQQKKVNKPASVVIKELSSAA